MPHLAPHPISAEATPRPMEVNGVPLDFLKDVGPDA